MPWEIRTSPPHQSREEQTNRRLSGQVNAPSRRRGRATCANTPKASDVVLEQVSAEIFFASLETALVDLPLR
jgi:hypothetical protein